MNTQKIQSHGRVAFKPTTKADLEFVLNSERHPDNSPYVKQWSRQQHLDALKDPNIRHFVVETAHDSKPVGYVIFVGLLDTDLCLELKRIVINEKRRGYGHDAVRLAMAYAFDQLCFHRVWLDVMKDNKRAYKVYRSLGFSVEGIHRQAARLGSSFKDLMVMSVLRREYYSCRHRLEYAPPMAFPDGERPGELCIRCDQGR